MRLEHIFCACNHQLLRRFHLLITENITAQVQAHLAPVPDRQYRHFYLVQAFPGTAFTPPIIVCLMFRHLAGQVQGHVLTAGPVRRPLQVVHPDHLVPPGHEIAVHTAVIGSPTIHIHRAIIGGNAFEAGRVDDAHEPLGPGIIGLAKPADLTRTPFLAGNPFNALVVILLLIPIE